MKNLSYQEKNTLFDHLIMWGVNTTLFTFVCTLWIITFTNAVTPWWILAICSFVMSLMFFRCPKAIFYPFVILIMIAVIAKFSGVH